MDVRLYAYFPHKIRFDFAQELYDCPIVFLLTGGQFAYRFDRQPPHTLQAGELIVWPAGTVFHRRVIDPITLHVLKVDQPPFSIDQPLRRMITPRISDDLERLAPFEFCAGHLPAEASHWGADILFEIAYELHRTPTTDNRTALRVLLREMAQQPAASYPNDLLCRRMCCCETRLIQLFRAETNQTPQQYLLTLRLQRSRVLLIQTDDPIQSIANRCGFSDPLYFSRLFSRRYGQPPRQFRAQNRL